MCCSSQQVHIGLAEYVDGWWGGGRFVSVVFARVYVEALSLRRTIKMLVAILVVYDREHYTGAELVKSLSTRGSFKLSR